eukprot:gene4438-8845_t
MNSRSKSSLGSVVMKSQQCLFGLNLNRIIQLLAFCHSFWVGDRRSLPPQLRQVPCAPSRLDAWQALLVSPLMFSCQPAPPASFGASGFLLLLGVSARSFAAALLAFLCFALSAFDYSGLSIF